MLQPGPAPKSEPIQCAAAARLRNRYGKAYIGRVEVIRDGVRIVQHDRSYGQGEQVLEPLHYLSTLGVKPAYLDHTAVYRNWRLPAVFTQLRERFETRHGSLPGARHFIRVLQLLAEHPLTRVEQAIQACRGDGVVTAERIAARCEQLALHSPHGEANLIGLLTRRAQIQRPGGSHFNADLHSANDPSKQGLKPE